MSAQHFTDPYGATPQPVDGTCTCFACQASGWTPAHGPLIRLANGFPWDGCDVHRASDLLLAAPYDCDCGCDTALADDWSAYDWTTPASVQHLMETGRPLRPGEVLTTCLTAPAR